MTASTSNTRLSLSFGLGLLTVVLIWLGGRHLILPTYSHQSLFVADTINQWPMPIDEVYEMRQSSLKVPEHRNTSSKGIPISIVLTIFNMEETIASVISAILENTIGPFELVAVYDGCSDNSTSIVRELMADYFTQGSRTPDRGCFDYKEEIHETSLFETLSNNIGMRMASTDYVVIVQDDMELVQQGWDRMLLRPALAYEDVFGVSARCAHDDIFENVDGGRIGRANFVGGGCGPHDYDTDPGQQFHVRDSAVRGPLLLDAKKLKKLEYLDEGYAPMELDDHDLCLRAYQQFGWVCGLYSHSVHQVGSQHRFRGDAPEVLRGAEGRNERYMLARHGKYLKWKSYFDWKFPERPSRSRDVLPIS